LTKLTLADVVGLTDSNNDLKIFGDSSDAVELKNDSGTWSTTSTVTENAETYNVYTNSGDTSVSVKIDTDINTTII